METYVFWYAATQFPSHSRLHSKSNVVQLNLPRPPCVLSINKGVRKHLGGIAIRELEQLMQNAWLRVLDCWCRRDEEGNSSGGWR